MAATALDFEALLRAEKERARRRRQRSRAAKVAKAAAGGAAHDAASDGAASELTTGAATTTTASGAGASAVHHVSSPPAASTVAPHSPGPKAATNGATGGPAAHRPGFPELTLPPRSPVLLESFLAVPRETLETVYYVPDFITAGEETELLASTYCPAAPWTNLRKRRLQMHGGTPTGGPQGMRREPLAPFMAACAKALVEAGVFDASTAPNHVLLNEYAPGQGIMPHKDGPLYHPVVGILSLASTCMLDFWPDLAESRKDRGKPIASVLCRPRSLLVFKDAAYTDVFHGIRETSEDYVGGTVANAAALGLEIGSVVPRERPRVSFTIRHVLNIADKAARARGAPSDGDEAGGGAAADAGGGVAGGGEGASGAKETDDSDDDSVSAPPLTAEAADEERRRLAAMLKSVSEDMAST